MAVTKDFLFETNEQQIAQLGKALSHPARVRIVHALLKNSAMCYHDLIEMTPLGRSVVDDHLRMLERYDLIRRVNLASNLAGYSLQHENYREYLSYMGGYLHPETRVRNLEGLREAAG